MSTRTDHRIVGRPRALVPRGCSHTSITMSCCTPATEPGPLMRSRALPEAVDVLVGDFTTIAGMRQVVEAANALGRFDAVIHNAAVGSSESRPIMTSDGMSHVFAVNVLAPYLLTSEIEMPRRLVYLSSGMHRGGNARLDDLQWERRRWSGTAGVLRQQALCRRARRGRRAPIPRCPVQRRRSRLGGHQDGGPGAPDDLAQGSVTQAWLAVFRRPRCPCVRRLLLSPAPERGRTAPCTTNRFQDELLAACAGICGAALPGAGQGG